MVEGKKTHKKLSNTEIIIEKFHYEYIEKPGIEMR